MDSIRYRANSFPIGQLLKRVTQKLLEADEAFDLVFPTVPATQRRSVVSGKYSINWAKINLPACMSARPTKNDFAGAQIALLGLKSRPKIRFIPSFQQVMPIVWIDVQTTQIRIDTRRVRA